MQSIRCAAKGQRENAPKFSASAAYTLVLVSHSRSYEVYLDSTTAADGAVSDNDAQSASEDILGGKVGGQQRRHQKFPSTAYARTFSRASTGTGTIAYTPTAHN